MGKAHLSFYFNHYGLYKNQLAAALSSKKDSSSNCRVSGPILASQARYVYTVEYG